MATPKGHAAIGRDECMSQLDGQTLVTGLITLLDPTAPTLTPLARGRVSFLHHLHFLKGSSNPPFENAGFAGVRCFFWSNQGPLRSVGEIKVALGIILQGPRGRRFLMGEVSLYGHRFRGYRGTSLIRITPLLGPYSRTI